MESGPMTSRSRWWLSALIFVTAPLACSGDIGDASDGESATGVSPTGTGSTRSPTGKSSGTSDPAPTSGPAAMSPGGVSAPTEGACAGAALPRRVRRLMSDEYRHTIASVFPALNTKVVDPFEGEEQVTRFATAADELRLPQPFVERIVDQNEAIATAMLDQMLRDYPCLTAGDGACVRTMLESFGARMFRRPLTSEEITSYSSFFTQTKAEFGASQATGALLQVLLASPSFLYRWELGSPESGKLTPYEIASGISYAATGAPPDERLWSLAKDGSLANKAAIEAELKRLIAGSNHASVMGFFQKYLKSDEILDSEKSKAVFPSYTPELGQALLADADAYVVEHYAGDLSFADLLTSRFVMARDKTAPIYGVSAVSGSAPRKVTDVANRTGILTQPAFIAAHSNPDILNPVKVGIVIRGHLLCAGVPPVPPNVNDLAESLEGAKRADLTVRELFESVHNQPPCAGCHSLIDPLGYAFGEYDALGQYRGTKENGKVIDASGKIAGAGTLDGPFTGAPELLQKMAGSPQVEDCFRNNVLWYFSGLSEDKSCAPPLAGKSRSLQETIVGVVSDYLLADRR
jgi:hypothetical protein